MILPEAKIMERRNITEDLFVIKLKPEVEFKFKPGQYATLGSNGIERAYSIASSPEEPLLEIFIELVPPPEGQLTPLLWELNEGESVTIRPRAKGIFTMDSKYSNQLMVSTVTGVAPFVSMLRLYIAQQGAGNTFHIIQGASYYDEFTYKDELEKIASECPNLLSYTATISRPDEEKNRGWRGDKKRANLIVEDYIQEHNFSTEDTLVYVCGHPGMIEDVKDKLMPKGYTVKEERFWKE
tara:strand:- start:798 stop:1514 length:717 start_codon:yes stop_codon:yes gene_type:complete